MESLIASNYELSKTLCWVQKTFSYFQWINQLAEIIEFKSMADGFDLMPLRHHNHYIYMGCVMATDLSGFKSFIRVILRNFEGTEIEANPDFYGR